MDKMIFSADQIIGKIREAEVLLSEGSTVGEVCRRLAISEQAYHTWRQEYSEMWIRTESGDEEKGR